MHKGVSRRGWGVTEFQTRVTLGRGGKCFVCPAKYRTMKHLLGLPSKGSKKPDPLGSG